MAQLKGFRLYVKLSSAQTRKRLKGHGFGVRKVESAGKGESLIIHTATGDHLRDLKALFADVLIEPGDPLPPDGEPPEL